MRNPEENEAPIDFDKLAAFRPQPKPTTTPAYSYLGAAGSSSYLAEAPGRASGEYYEIPRERPGVVTVVAVLNFIAAALFAIVALLAWGSVGDDSSNGGVAIVAVIQMAASLIIGIGLWKLKRWAYYLAIVGYIFSLGSSLLGTFNEPITGGTLIGLLIPAVILFFLFRPSTREAFEE